MNTHKITNLAAPTNPNDSARLIDVQNVQNMPTTDMYRQSLINSNFDVWQRGTNFVNPASSSFTADRYAPNFTYDGGTAPTTITHSRQTVTPGDVPNSFYYYRINNDTLGTSLGANAIYQLRQKIEYGTRYLCGDGKKVTVSFWARSSIAGKRLCVYISQNYGSGGAPSAAEDIAGQAVTLTSSWQKFTVTITTNTLVGKTYGTSNDDSLHVLIATMWGATRVSIIGGGSAETFVGAGNIDIAQMQVNSGDIALPFQPKSVGTEMEACQRYYEKSFSLGTVPAHGAGSTGIHAMRSAVTDSFQSFPRVIYKVVKRITPTFTMYNPSNASPGSNVIRVFGTGADVPGQTAEGNEKGIRISVSNTSVPGLNDLGVHWTAEAEL
jgi:hypothetical protein